MIFSYNKDAVGDTLMVIVANAKGQEVNHESRGSITRVFVKNTKETVGWNFFKISSTLTDLVGKGQIDLTDEQLTALNHLLAAEGFSEQVSIDRTPKIVTGFVKSCKAHPDSDHLSITQTEVDHGEVLQIVCGAPNIKAGLKVVVAKPGAMMPDGLIIWPGELRGQESHGMICSARELAVPNAPTARGILELPFDTEIGEAFIGSDYQL
ncbi:DUF4479 and tRNA-binding domain-containing protein [Vagococcus sp. BWB3-3]|uniref:DUF4479 and tRNA-binding domain-containing protein n=1 Tax=Vagococcus allomyrinae TaxID=2794353 RepID=A0A940P870_9ENTE|nr:DUF4479 and tRNA-binding domain-containing protein [Vagococcus allomyrinae]MBP1039865.1 DUF4479 and tRNA-binding domain-containing protein [Vagococcus allomyrinae]